MARYLLSGNGGPNGANWGHFKSEAYDRIINRIETSDNPGALASGTTQAHQLIVDEALLPVRRTRPEPGHVLEEGEGLRAGAVVVPGLHHGVHGK